MQHSQNRLSQLPSNVLSYIYAFDGTFSDKFKNDEFHLELLYKSGEASRIIKNYIAEFFSQNYIWINYYGLFATTENVQMKNMDVYREYIIITKMDKINKRICFNIRPVGYENDTPLIDRCDGFISHDMDISDVTYLGVETYKLGKMTHLYVDDL
jgi:hypothetical protein